jgi:hypothetical protein
MGAISTLGAIALGVGALGGVGSAVIGSNAARSAGRAQEAAAQQGIAEQQRQFEAMRELLKPYVEAGDPALQALMGAAGLRGPESQQAFIAEQEANPLFQGLARQGEDAILQNASATGGLRGGNVQGALGQFRPALLNDFVQQQYSRLAGITSLGQNSAAMQGNAGLQTGQNIASQYGNIGAAQAGSALGVANAFGQGINQFAGGLGQAAAFGAFGGRAPAGGTIVPQSGPFQVPNTFIPAFGAPRI